MNDRGYRKADAGHKRAETAGDYHRNLGPVRRETISFYRRLVFIVILAILVQTPIPMRYA